MLSREGLTLAADTPVAAIRSGSRPGSARSAADATTRKPPADSTTTTSITAASNPNEANWSDPTPGPAPKAARMPPARFIAPACATPTPFGRPVEPEVYTM